MTATVRSGNQDIDGLLSDYRWTLTPQPLRFGFPIGGGWSGYDPGSEPFVNYQQLSALQRDVATRILASVEGFTNLSFVNSESVGETPYDATLRFGMTDDTESAHAYTPYFDDSAGDVWFNNSSGDYDSPIPGSYDYVSFLHEIGHAIGLKHPHETDHFGAMPLEHDHMNYTVMSYRSYYNMDLESLYGNEDFGYAQTFMMYDIAALQHLYGADFTTRSGNTVYKWGPASGATTIDGVVTISPGANRIFLTVWDGGGIDTYDFSAYADALNVDLAPGAWSMTSFVQRADLGDGRRADGNIANALLYQGDLRSLIENAIGGSGDDTMFGNQGANRLVGRGGNDSLDGRSGADRLEGGPGNDRYQVDNSGDLLIELAGEGFDEATVTAAVYVLGANVEWMTGILAAGQTLTGNAGDNRIVALNPGNDHLDDTYVVDNLGDSIADYGGAADSVIASLSWTLVSTVENLTLSGDAAIDGTGNDSANVLTGNSAANVLDGRGGADRMTGGAGNDRYVVDNDGDLAIELAGGGVDEIVSSRADQSLPDQIENLTGAVAAQGVQTLRGNSLGNVITGAASDTIYLGSGGQDVVNAGAGQDVLHVEWTDSTRNVVVTAVIAANDPLGGYDGAFSDGGMRGVTFSSIERLILATGSGKDVVAAPRNNDLHEIRTGAGDDRVDAGIGVAIADGGAGIDGVAVDHSAQGLDIHWGLRPGTPASSTIHNFEYFIDLRTGFGSDSIYTGLAALNDVVSTGGGADTIVVSNGHDQVDGGADSDRLQVEWQDKTGAVTFLAPLTGSAAAGWGGKLGTASYSVTFAAIEQLYVYTGPGNDVLRGGSGDDRFETGAGNDFIDGGAGGDWMIGGAGNDIYVVDDFWDQIEETGTGIDEVRTALASYMLTTGVENLTGLSNAGQTLRGNTEANLIAGGTGADQMLGSYGNDVYLVGAGDTVEEYFGEGTDEVRTALGVYTLGDHVEKLTGLSNAGQTLTGNDVNNALTGGAGNDRLDGGLGADQLAGGLGHDLYTVGAGDLVVEAAGAGTDEVRTALAGYTLTANVEKLTGLSAAGQALTGNSLANILTGGTGNDVLNGGTGADKMVGGLGNDRYFVDDMGDVVAESGGVDEVRTTLASYTAAAGVEHVLGLLNTGQTLRGNTLNNILAGGAGADLLRLTEVGSDTARGGGGDDILLFGAALTSADVADGGTGTDALVLQGDYTAGRAVTLGNVTGIERLVLLAGNDTSYGDPGTGSYSYVIATANANVAAGALLSVEAGALRAGETLAFNGAAESDGRFAVTGGAGADTIAGGAQADTLRGGLGGDTLRGNGGNDMFVYRSAGEATGDRVEGGSGSDTLLLDGAMSGGIAIGAFMLASVETIRLVSAATGYNAYNLAFGGGNVAAGQILVIDGSALRYGEGLTVNAVNETAGAFDMTGGASRDTLLGSAGNDVLRGGLASDYLNGNGGADRLVYGSAAESTGVNFDRLAGFDHRVDTIDLPASVSGWASDVNGGALRAASFDSDLAAALDAALGAGQAILFRPDSGDLAGRLFAVVDANGDGAYQAGQDYVFEFVAPVVPLAPVTDYFV